MEAQQRLTLRWKVQKNRRCCYSEAKKVYELLKGDRAIQRTKAKNLPRQRLSGKREAVLEECKQIVRKERARRRHERRARDNSKQGLHQELTQRYFRNSSHSLPLVCGSSIYRRTNSHSSFNNISGSDELAKKRHCLKVQFMKIRQKDIRQIDSFKKGDRTTVVTDNATMVPTSKIAHVQTGLTKKEQRKARKKEKMEQTKLRRQRRQEHCRLASLR